MLRRELGLAEHDVAATPPVADVRLLARVRDLVGIARLQILLQYVLDLLAQSSAISLLKRAREQIATLVSALYFLAYHAQAPVLVRLALRALKKLLPLLEEGGSGEHGNSSIAVRCVLDYRYIIRNCTNKSEVLQRIAEQRSAKSEGPNNNEKLPDVVPLFEERELTFRDARADSRLFAVDNSTLLLHKLGACIIVEGAGTGDNTPPPLPQALNAAVRSFQAKSVVRRI
jgi:hypothetical protein